jgi:hypothetical protein
VTTAAEIRSIARAGAEFTDERWTLRSVRILDVP